MKTFLRVCDSLAAVLLVALAGCANPTQLLLDAELDRLCASEAGVRVYQTAPRPGNWMSLPYKSALTPGDLYYLQGETTRLKHGADNPLRGEYELLRVVDRLHRATDNKVLGERVTFIRRGADVQGPWHSSGKACPKQPGRSLEDQVFGASAK